MSKRRRRRNNQPDDVEVNQIREHIAQKTRRVLFVLESILIAGCLIVIFRIGESMYPAWVIEYRNLIIGVLLSIIVVVFLASPVIVEVNSNPRPLSGPGDRPSGYW